MKNISVEGLDCLVKILIDPLTKVELVRLGYSYFKDVAWSFKVWMNSQEIGWMYDRVSIRLI